MCHACNMKTDEALKSENLPPLRIGAGTICVFANRSETCDNPAAWENIKATVAKL